MRLPRDLSGDDLVKKLGALGTLNAILREVSSHLGIEKAELVAKILE